MYKIHLATMKKSESWDVFFKGCRHKASEIFVAHYQSHGTQGDHSAKKSSGDYPTDLFIEYAISVRKKSGCAVQRNLFRRRFRESLRKYFSICAQLPENSGRIYKIFFSLKKKVLLPVQYDKIEMELYSLLVKIISGKSR